MMMTFQKGWSNLDNEVTIERLPVTGQIPSWLEGHLFRNGPAKFSMGDEPPTHWFDGLAMIHKFSFHNGSVSYANRYVRSDAYWQAMEQGKLAGGFGKASTGVQRALNPNVNIAKIADRYIAMTEVPSVIEFDPHSLDTIGLFSFGDDLPGQLSTAHPQYDIDNGEYFNFNVEFGPTNLYHVYRMQPGSRTRETICSVPTKDVSYMHSFAMTENYIVLTQFPLFIDLQKVFSGLSLAESFNWLPEQGTTFTIIDKHGGGVIRTHQSDAFFAFHQVNAFETNDGICLDISASSDAGAVHELYVEKTLSGDPSTRRISNEFRRYRLFHGSQYAESEALSSEQIELPTISYHKQNGKHYQYAYGVGNSRTFPESVLNQLVKVHVPSGDTRIWREENCYPGEPVFVPAPGSVREDDGVVLSVALDGLKGHSFLLMLDGMTFTEIGRAAVPHHIPFGFHGSFVHAL